MFRDMVLHIAYVVRAYAVSLAVMLGGLFALVAIFNGGSFDGMGFAWMLVFIIFLLAPINALFVGLCHWIGLNKNLLESIKLIALESVAYILLWYVICYLSDTYKFWQYGIMVYANFVAPCAVIAFVLLLKKFLLK